MSARAWLRASRPLAQGNIAPSIVLGLVLGAHEAGRVSWIGVAVALAFGVLDHLAIVYVNDADDEAADRHNATPTLVSGGSRVLVEGLLTRAQLARAGKLASIALLGLSVAASVVAPWLPALALGALGLLWLYSGAPRLGHRGGGAWLQGLGIGIVLPLVGHASQTDALPEPIVLAPTFLLGVSGHLLTAMPDAEGDRAASKRTLASVRGPHVAAWVAALVSALAIVLGANVFGHDSTTASVLTWVPMALLLFALTQLRQLDGDPRARLRFVLLALGAGSAALVLWTGAVALR